MSSEPDLKRKLLSPDPARVGRPAGPAQDDAVAPGLVMGTPEPLKTDLIGLLGPMQVLQRVSDLVRYASDASPYRLLPQVVVQPRHIVDIVTILEKMRVSLIRLQIDVSGTRRDEEPRRYLNLHLTYHMSGERLDETKARRAIDLSIEKYCSVVHSLAPDIPITYDLVLG